ncbi:MAG: FAD-dependent oxidoreductase, partial [Candidatus Omnitrophica bacterium]|nr:FAD-dependent oxidoreductase [Candidatus Omnitrophota bacterium]
EYVEFTKKLTESDYSKALNKLKPGDWVRLKMPNGAFTFEGEHKKIALLTGGIGITPFRSICKFAKDRNLPADIVLLYGSDTEEDIIFREDFDRMAKEYNNLRVIYTLTSPAVDGSTWKGKTGLIDGKMIKEEIPDFGERIFYYCGSPKIVQYLDHVLKAELSVPDSRLMKENFPGY